MKYLSLTLSLLLGILGLASCSKESVQVPHKEPSRQEEILNSLEQNIRSAKLHSDGLEYVYRNIKKEHRPNSLRSLSQDALQYYADKIIKVSDEYASSRGEDFGVLLPLTSRAIISMVDANRVSENPQAVTLRSFNPSANKDTPKEVLIFLEEINRQVTEYSTKEEVKTIVSNALTNNISTSHTENIQKVLSMTGAVYIDSFEYWSKNLNKWGAMINGEEEQLRGWWDDMKASFKQVASDDAEAAGKALITAGLVALAGGPVASGGAIATASIVGSAYSATSRALRYTKSTSRIVL